MQKPCNENPSLKFRETQSFTKSLSVSTAEGFPRFTSIIIAAWLYCTYRNHIACYPLKNRKKRKKKETDNKKEK